MLKSNFKEIVMEVFGDTSNFKPSENCERDELFLDFLDYQIYINKLQTKINTDLSFLISFYNSFDNKNLNEICDILYDSIFVDELIHT